MRHVACPKCSQPAKIRTSPTKVRCLCGTIYLVNDDTPTVLVPDCNVGPGKELQELLFILRIEKKECCGCAAMIQKMNAWGPDGCEANMPEIVDHLRKAYKEQSWASVTAASFTALTTSLAFQLDWIDPIPSLVRFAIDRYKSEGGIG